MVLIPVSYLTDPFSMAPQKALETIGRTLNQQYERWQPRVRKCFATNLISTVDKVLALII